MSKWFNLGAPWIWLTGGAVSISLLSVLGLLLLIGWKGLSYFWPAPLYQWTTNDGHTLVGQLYNTDYVPIGHLKEMDISFPPEIQAQGVVKRLSVKIANRELYSADFVHLLAINIASRTTPKDLAVVERTENGDFYGKPVGIVNQDGSVSKNLSVQLAPDITYVQTVRDEIHSIINRNIKQYASKLENLQLDKKRKELEGKINNQYLAQYHQKRTVLLDKLNAADKKVDQLRAEVNQRYLLMQEMTGKQVKIPLGHVLDIWYPNRMTLLEKVSHWCQKVWVFLSENPREANSEGGVFPAIFGTVLLVIIMSIIVMPLGVVAAIYLHEYAKNNWLTRIVRIAVINLAGVPSIVYGVFGLGFFVYTIGTSIDKLFYSEKLPVPTFGTPGLLWSALTLAVLTLPVVIVATEEGLSRIPKSVRHGSLALGATQFETLYRIILPMVTPAMLTGLILAVARAAGEVAPLMLVGAVKLTSSLPIDGQFPYLHLDRKFMYLGFHIYDIGFQSTNIESARPLVYATSFLLVTVIVGLNLTAISIRNNLREKYRVLGQD
ncbi:phosphate ABC transporter permease PstA [Vibrio sp. S4M6]|uniref:phosphate ABC transporter permease PstA n=1 Tax=Vibrio sinus TaxID=2946865 RepID=UPI00202A7BFB|nr:phosphate ABC transporter permease PstA [Vibrio sinus]MCL9782238.1 phosphate ABC transporter permease PstA [Vibrio sinus]